jgi:hypothetical protein
MISPGSTPMTTVQWNKALLALVVLTMTLFGVQAVALAQTARERAGQHVVEGDAHKDRAEKLHDEGDDEAAREEFLAAADEYQAAYDLVPHPLMLYNLAQVYRLAGEDERALRLYREFLATGPDGEAASFARQYVRALERSLERRGDGRGEDVEELSDEGDDDLLDGSVDEGDEIEDEDVGGEEGFEVESATDAGGGYRTFGLVSVGVGALSVLVGIKYGLDASAASDCLSSYPAGCERVFPAAQWSDAALALQEEGRQDEQRMYLFAGVGAALIVGGGVLYYLGHERGEKRKSGALSLRPKSSGRELGVVLSGRF